MAGYGEEKAQNLEFYRIHREELGMLHPGKYVAIAKGDLCAVGDTFDEVEKKCLRLAPEAWHRLIFNTGADRPIQEDEYFSHARVS
jgi:hypothetical protein